jgi:peptidoglycan/LPS O-acetylase OafA/YrhL
MGWRGLSGIAAVALCVAAALGIVEVLGGSNVELTAARLIYTVIPLALFGLVALAGIVLAVRRPALAWFGYLTAVIAALALVAVTVSVWEGDFGLFGSGGELPAIGAALALASGQISMLLAWRRRPGAGRWIAYAAGLAIGLLALLAVVLIVADSAEISPRVFGVLAILYLLAMALLPLAALAERTDSQPADPRGAGAS